MIDDSELLQQYAKEDNQAAFAEIVQRHLNLVYSAALRQVGGDDSLAKDVSQTVFTDLARKAASLTGRSMLTGWLYTSTHFAAANIVRTERRRAEREQEAHAMQQLLHDSAPEPNFHALSTTLDDVMHQLTESDREAVLLRYFENRAFAEIGARFGVAENTARMRVERALEKLRTLFKQRGVTLSAVALAALLSANAVSAAPAGLAAVLGNAAIKTAATSAPQPVSSLVQAIVKSKLTVLTAVVAVTAVSVTLLFQEFSSRPATNAPVGKESNPVGQLATGPATLHPKLADPENARRLLQRRNESLRTTADAAAATNDTGKFFGGDFDPAALADEPGIKKFYGVMPATLTNNQTFVTGGWSTAPGKRTIVFLTPTFDSDGPEKKEILFEARLFEGPEQAFEDLEPVNGIVTGGHQSSICTLLSSEQSRSILAKLKARAGVDLLTAPRLTTTEGTEASLSVTDQKVIAGKTQTLGPTIHIAPTSRNGPALSLVIGTRLTLADTSQP